MAAEREGGRALNQGAGREVLMRKGCIVLVVIGLTLAGVAAGIAWHVLSLTNPVYHGKRIFTWADQAIRHDWWRAPRVRMRSLGGRRRFRRLTGFCSPHGNGTSDATPHNY